MYMSNPHTYFLEALSKLSLDSTTKSAIAKIHKICFEAYNPEDDDIDWSENDGTILDDHDNMMFELQKEYEDELENERKKGNYRDNSDFYDSAYSEINNDNESLRNILQNMVQQTPDNDGDETDSVTELFASRKLADVIIENFALYAAKSDTDYQSIEYSDFINNIIAELTTTSSGSTDEASIISTIKSVLLLPEYTHFTVEDFMPQEKRLHKSISTKFADNILAAFTDKINTNTTKAEELSTTIYNSGEMQRDAYNDLANNNADNVIGSNSDSDEIHNAMNDIDNVEQPTVDYTDENKESVSFTFNQFANNVITIIENIMKKDKNDDNTKYTSLYDNTKSKGLFTQATGLAKDRVKMLRDKTLAKLNAQKQGKDAISNTQQLANMLNTTISEEDTNDLFS